MSLRVGIPSIGMKAALTIYQQMEQAAIAAARNNGAALWYAGNNPSGFVYQDSAGTIPATGTDPIGLLLDRSYGPEPQISSNPGGPFITTSGYTAFNSTIAVVSGELEVTGSGGAFPSAVLNIPVVSGRTYRFIFNRRQGTASLGAAVVVQTAGGSNFITPVTTNSTSLVTDSITFTAAATENYRLVFYIPNAAATGTIYASLLSVKQLLGYPALQSTAANKPTLELQANGYYGIRSDGVSDTLTTTLALGGASSQFTIIAALSGSTNTGTQVAVGSFNGAVASRAYLSKLNQFLGAGAGSATQADSLITTKSVYLTQRIASICKNATNALLYVDGVLEVSPSVTDAGTPVAINLFSGSDNGGASVFWPGTISLVCAAPSVLPNADRIAIERFAALLSGATYTA